MNQVRIQSRLRHIDGTFASTSPLTLIIPLSCINRLVLRPLSQRAVTRSDTSLAGREDAADPILTPAVRVQGG